MRINIEEGDDHVVIVLIILKVFDAMNHVVFVVLTKVLNVLTSQIKHFSHDDGL